LGGIQVVVGKNADAGGGDGADPYGPVVGITAIAQTITPASIPDHLSNDLPFTLAPTSTPGLTVSLAIVSGPATIAGNLVTLAGAAGTVVIQATQAGDGTDAAGDASKTRFRGLARAGWMSIALNAIVGDPSSVNTYRAPEPLPAGLL
jgi:hypothetical protein